jgi:hypothetical protein
MTSNPATSNNWADKIFKKNEAVVSRKIGSELFLIPVKGTLADMQRIFTLNPVAEYVWQQLDNRNLHDICEDVVSAFEVEKEQAEVDVHKFITELLDANLIEKN